MLSSLNKKQKNAATTIEGPILVLAGPGSGKTKTLTSRVAYLINSGVAPQNILTVTFTNKAANEMKQRVEELLLKQSQPTEVLPHMGTFHSICVKILRETAPLLGYTSQFTIYDDSDQLSLVKKVAKETNIDTQQITPQKIRGLISGAKDNLLTPEEYEANAENFVQEEVAKVYKKYQKHLELNNGLDFDDLIMKTVLLFKNNKDVLKKYQNRFRYIMVDEYQDTNTTQYTWLRLLASGSRNICVVGDDAQAIYSWRNANLEHILSFKDDWPDAKIIKLEQNYRSTQTIIKAAANIIKNNNEGYKKDLWTQNPQGERLTLKEALDEHKEAQIILDEIKNMHQQGHKLKEFVVLYRTNAQSRAIEEVFMRANMPYKIVGGVKFYQRQEIKDSISWLRLLQNEKDEASRGRVQNMKAASLKSNLEQKTKNKADAVDVLLKDFKNKLEEETNLHALLGYILEKISYEKEIQDGTEKGEERWSNVQELVSVTKDYSHMDTKEALNKFLEDVTLMQEADTVSDEKEVVHLMTLHMAKGLEFPVVFIAGCEEGILPHLNSMASQKQLEEERRLLYVGITRAKEKAHLLFTRRRMLWGSIQANPPSSFLFEIPEEYIEFIPLAENEDLIEEDIIEWD